MVADVHLLQDCTKEQTHFHSFKSLIKHCALPSDGSVQLQLSSSARSSAQQAMYAVVMPCHFCLTHGTYVTSLCLKECVYD